MSDGDDVGAMADAVELVEELGVCLDVLEVVSLTLEGAAFTSILAWVLFVHAEGGGLEAGKDSTRARKGTGRGPSIRCTRRDNRLPRFRVPIREGQDRAREVESSLSSLSDSSGAILTAWTMSECRRSLGSSWPLSADCKRR